MCNLCNEYHTIYHCQLFGTTGILDTVPYCGVGVGVGVGVDQDLCACSGWVRAEVRVVIVVYKI